MSVLVKIENSYSDGHESSALVNIAPPEKFDEEGIEDWFLDDVFPHTGDGHGADRRDITGTYEATVIEGPPELLGQTWEW